MGNTTSTNDTTGGKNDLTDRTMFEEYVSNPNQFHDLQDRMVVITGTSEGGMGFYIAEIAIRKNAKLVVCLNRNSESAKRGEHGLKKIIHETKSNTVLQVVTCDMQDLASVEAAAREVNEIAKENGGLDVLVCNSGIMATGDERTKDGFDVQMQTNHLSHFLLTKLVWPSIAMAGTARGDARVVLHSSAARDVTGTMLQEKYFQKCADHTLGGDDSSMMVQSKFGWGGPWQRYHQTKLANACFAMELHNRIKANGIADIKAIAADPGIAASKLFGTTQKDGLTTKDTVDRWMRTGHSPENGCLSAAMAAFSPDAKSGDMYLPSKGTWGFPVKCIESGKPVRKNGEKLTCSRKNELSAWKFSEKGLGVTFAVAINTAE
jgi:NAD(P)-dependent dehydrogenase (short-subunit alcohol dehydrogenase family)